MRAAERYELLRDAIQIARTSQTVPVGPLRALDAVHDRIESPASKLLRAVEPWSSYLVLPLFALASAGLGLVRRRPRWTERLVAAIVLETSSVVEVGSPVGTS